MLRLERAVVAFFDEKDLYVLPGKQACFVRFEGTTFDLASRLELTGAHARVDCPALIVKVGFYGGFAPADLWNRLRNWQRY